MPANCFAIKPHFIECGTGEYIEQLALNTYFLAEPAQAVRCHGKFSIADCLTENCRTHTSKRLIVFVPLLPQVKQRFDVKQKFNRGYWTQGLCSNRSTLFNVFLVSSLKFRFIERKC